MRIARGLVLASVALGGCTLYFDDDEEKPPICETFVDGYPSIELRDPTTSLCSEFGNPGGGGCGGVGLPIGTLPDWGSCHSTCDGLPEDSCLAAPGCNAAYTTQAFGDDAGVYFNGCFEAAPSGPVQGSCFNLDAQACSRHDDCSLIYVIDSYVDSRPAFTECRAEAAALDCSDVQCGPDAHCEQTCYDGALVGNDSCSPTCVPDVSPCTATDCGPGFQCIETCETMDPSAATLWPGECTATCEPTTTCSALTTEAACAARGDCTNVYNGDSCTCYPGGACDCETLTWDRCQSL